MSVLKEMHYVRELEGEKKTGRPSRKILVNPKIHEEQES